MKLVIQTQISENYGAFDWDGEGECPQYWKMKGGNTYIIKNATSLAVAMEGESNLSDLLTYSDEYSEEYIIDCTIEENDAVVCEEWETPYMLKFDTDIKRWRCTRTFSYLHSEFLEKQESWLVLPKNQREDYRALYLMENGATGIGEDFLESWFKMNESEMA